MASLLSQTPAIDRGLFETANYIEAGLWFVVAIAFFCYAFARKNSREDALAAGITFLLFGVSDVIEVQTGAWWRPWWLFCLKALCVLSMLVLLVRYWRRPIECRRPAANGRDGDSPQTFREDLPDIDKDIPCMECDYNLCGLNPTGRCPECGTEIAATFKDKYRFRLRGEHILAGILLIYVCMLYWSLASMSLLRDIAGIDTFILLGVYTPITMVLLGLAMFWLGPRTRLRNLLGFLIVYASTALLYTWLCIQIIAGI